MKKLTVFSWGYWGWGSSAAQFVKASDAVEASRGYDSRIGKSISKTLRPGLLAAGTSISRVTE